jgi:hypothetical protein
MLGNIKTHQVAGGHMNEFVAVNKVGGDSVFAARGMADQTNAGFVLVVFGVHTGNYTELANLRQGKPKPNNVDSYLLSGMVYPNPIPDVGSTTTKP